MLKVNSAYKYSKIYHTTYGLFKIVTSGYQAQINVTLILFFSITLWGCKKKEGITKVQGSVFNFELQKHIKSKVILIEHRNLLSSYTDLQEKETDNNGFFDFDFYASKAKKYYIFALPDDELYDISSDIKINKVETNVISFECIRNGTVAFQIENTGVLDTLSMFNCTIGYDYKLNLVSERDIFESNLFIARKSRQAKNLIGDTTIYIHPKIGFNIITYTTKKIIKKEMKDTINITVNDTSFIKIEY